MGNIFFWMDRPPANALVQNWEQFLDNMAVVSLGSVAVCVALIWWTYSNAAKHRRILAPEDVFAPYKPFYWVPTVAALAAALAGGTWVWQYHEVLGPEAGDPWMSAFWTALWTGVWTFLLGYLVILIPGVTPAKFRYGPRRLFYRGRGGFGS